MAGSGWLLVGLYLLWSLLHKRSQSHYTDYASTRDIGFACLQVNYHGVMAMQCQEGSANQRPVVLASEAATLALRACPTSSGGSPSSRGMRGSCPYHFRSFGPAAVYVD